MNQMAAGDSLELKDRNNAREARIREIAAGLYGVLAMTMAKHKISLEKAYGLLMDNDIDVLHRSDNTLIGALYKHCIELLGARPEEIMEVRDAYAELRLRIFREMRPKKNGKDEHGGLQTIIHAISHLADLTHPKND